MSGVPIIEPDMQFADARHKQKLPVVAKKFCARSPVKSVRRHIFDNGATSVSVEDSICIGRLVASGM